jgi:hypothetical protein
MRVLSKLQNLCFLFVSTFIAINKESIFERKFLNLLKNKTDAMYALLIAKKCTDEEKT